MKPHGARVVLGWALGNGALAAMLAGFGGSWIPIVLYFCVVGLLTSFGVAVFISIQRHPLEGQRQEISTRGEVGVSFATTCFFLGLTGVYGLWFLVMAIPMAVFTVYLMLRVPSRAPS